jgi:hypothetical protein
VQVEEEVKYTAIKSKEKEKSAAAKTVSPSKPSGHDVRFVRVSDSAALSFSVEDGCHHFLP